MPGEVPCGMVLSADERGHFCDILHGIPVTGEAIKDLQAAKQFVSDYLYNQDVVTADVHHQFRNPRPFQAEGVVPEIAEHGIQGCQQSVPGK
jgi:hypothetical protein